MAEAEPGVRCSYKEKVYRLREEAILDATQEILSEKGFSGLSVDEITDRVGISKPTLYLHFACKDDILVAIARRGVKYGVDILNSLDPSLSAAERIRVFVNKAVECRFGEKGIRFGETGFAASRLSKAWQDKVKDDAVLLDKLFALFSEAEAGGQLRGGVTALCASRFLMAIVRDAGLEILVDSKALKSQEMADAYMCMILA